MEQPLTMNANGVWENGEIKIRNKINEKSFKSFKTLEFHVTKYFHNFSKGQQNDVIDSSNSFEQK